MNKQTIIIGFAILLLSVVGIWLWLSSTKPSQAEIDSSSSNILQINTNLLDAQSTKNLSDRKINGDIPVKIESNYNNGDIFN